MESTTIVEQLSAIEHFSAFSKAELETLAAAVQVQTYEFGDTIFNAGDAGEGLYFINTGSVRIFTEEAGKEISMGVRKQGEVFAETAALRELRHESSARAASKTELWLIPRATFAATLANNPEAERFVARLAAVSAAGGFINRLFKLRGKIASEELEQLINSIGIKRVPAEGTILEQEGREDQRLYVVRQGSVRVTRREDDREYPLASLNAGEVFGERSCLSREPQLATVSAVTDSVLLVIPQATVQRILELNPSVREALDERISFERRELERHKRLAERRGRRISLDLRSRPGLGERVIKRFPLIEQAEQSDCGAACLAMISKHYGIPMTLGKLRELANVTIDGATMESLARVGESLGFTTRGMQCTYNSLLGMELPFIAHWEGYHYVVVYGVSKSKVWVADPAMGFRKLDRDEFERGWSGTCLVFSPGAQMLELATTRSPWTRFVRYLRPHKKTLCYLIMATLVIEALGVAPPVIVQNILDRVLVHNSLNLLHVLIVGLAITHIFSNLTTLLRAFLSAFMVRNLDLTMMSQFFQHTMALPLAFFTKRKTGDIFARFQENATIRDFLTESTISTILNLMMVFVYLAVLFMYSAKMTGLLLAMVVPMALLTVLVTPKLKNYARRAFETSTDAEATLMETLSGSETVKAMGAERSMRQKWEKKYASALDVQYRAQRFGALVGMTSGLLNAATSVVVLWVGATLVLQQELTIGQLVAFNMLMGSVLAPLMGLIGMWDELQQAAVAMERLGDVLELEPEEKPEELPSRIMLPDMRGEVSVENVYFRYGGTESSYVLENVSFTVEAGQTVAIVGHSGSGKTTLAKLLVGFYPPTEGKIMIDGYDLSLIDKEYFRSQVGYVMQNNLLFSGSIADNIALGDPNPDRKHLVEVSKLADAHGFVNALPLGYEQLVGERGMGLSGGQVQRLCIARALYHDPKLLIFDEATSALDSQSEDNILNNMQQVLHGRSAIVIAHRLSTVMNADKILVLYDGNIVEQGIHSELVDKRGMYYQLVQRQIASSG